jgi:hypothetical protein
MVEGQPGLGIDVAEHPPVQPLQLLTVQQPLGHSVRAEEEAVRERTTRHHVRRPWRTSRVGQPFIHR